MALVRLTKWHKHAFNGNNMEYFVGYTVVKHRTPNLESLKTSLLLYRTIKNCAFINVVLICPHRSTYNLQSTKIKDWFGLRRQQSSFILVFNCSNIGFNL